MSWKNLAQTSLSDALAKHHEALEELDGIDRFDRLGSGSEADGRHPCQEARQGGVAAVADVQGLVVARLVKVYLNTV